MKKFSLITCLAALEVCLLSSFSYCSPHAGFTDNTKAAMLNGKHTSGYTSPDRKFTVIAHEGDGGYMHIAVRSYSNNKKIVYQSGCVGGFGWLPSRPHTLIFSVDSDNDGEKPGIFLWKGKKKLEVLKEIKTVDRENVSLVGISKKGDKILYNYWPNLMDNNSRNLQIHLKSLKIP